ncbi:MAG: glycosyltransferase family 39 protein [archaeon]
MGAPLTMGYRTAMAASLKRDRYFCLLIGILLLSLFFRVYGLSAGPLRNDEAYDTVFRGMDAGVAIQLYRLLDWGPPVFYRLIIRLSSSFLPYNEWGLRYPSVIFGAISVLLIYYLGAHLFSKKTGLIAALLMGINPFHIYYSQLARGYSLFIMLVMLSSLAFFQFIKSRGYRSLLAYTAVTLLALYTHETLVFLVVVQNVLFFLQYRGSGRALLKWLIPNFLFVAAFFGIYNFFFFHRVKVRYTETLWWIPRPEPGALFGTLKSFLYGPYYHLTNHWFQLLLGMFAFFVLFLLIHSLASPGREAWKLSYLVLLLIVPVASVYIWSVLGTPYSLYNNDYLVVCLPPLILLLSYAISGLKRGHIPVFVILFLAVVGPLIVLGGYSTVQNRDVRGAAGYIQSINPDALILVYPSWYMQLANFYLGQRSRISSTKSGEEFRQAIGNETEFWILFGSAELPGDYESIYGITDNETAKGYDVTVSRARGIDIFRFVRRGCGHHPCRSTDNGDE